MALTTVEAGNRVEQWSRDFFKEYVRATPFLPYTGTGANATFQMKNELTKAAGDRVSFSLVRKLTGQGVQGDTSLEGAEESLDNFAHRLTVDLVRNGVVVHKSEQIKTVLDLLSAAGDMLKFWAADRLRDQEIAALQSPVIDGLTAYSAATEAQKDAWLAANSDRVLFGAATSNNSGNDHSASLSNVTAGTDELSPDILSLAKRRAMKPTNGAIRPIRINGTEEWFPVFAGQEAFRDLKADTTMRQSNREAWIRGRNNPLFRDGDLIWDGMIIRQVPEIPIIAGVGASSIDVAPVFLCGAQAVGVGWAQMTKTIFDERDYKAKRGVAIEEIRGVEKFMHNSVQHGVHTIYVPGVSD